MNEEKQKVLKKDLVYLQQNTLQNLKDIQNMV